MQMKTWGNGELVHVRLIMSNVLWGGEWEAGHAWSDYPARRLYANTLHNLSIPFVLHTTLGVYKDRTFAGTVWFPVKAAAQAILSVNTLGGVRQSGIHIKETEYWAGQWRVLATSLPTWRSGAAAAGPSSSWVWYTPPSPTNSAFHIARLRWIPNKTSA